MHCIANNLIPGILKHDKIWEGTFCAIVPLSKFWEYSEWITFRVICSRAAVRQTVMSAAATSEPSLYARKTGDKDEDDVTGSTDKEIT